MCPHTHCTCVSSHDSSTLGKVVTNEIVRSVSLRICLE